MPVVNPSSTVTMGAGIAVTARQQLPNRGARTVLIRSAKTNTVAVWLGDSTVTTAGAGNVLMDLQPGEAIFLDIGNSNLLYAAASSSSTIYVSGME
jgi:hypothetical protein